MSIKIEHRDGGFIQSLDGLPAFSFGKKVRDMISGFTGTYTRYSKSITGELLIEITPFADPNAVTLPEAYWIDIHRVGPAD